VWTLDAEVFQDLKVKGTDKGRFNWNTCFITMHKSDSIGVPETQFKAFPEPR
jgi:hypothetical protein